MKLSFEIAHSVGEPVFSTTPTGIVEIEQQGDEYYLIGKGAGTATVSLSFAGNDLYEASNAISKTVTVASPLEPCEIPEIMLDSNGDLMVSCSTDGAVLHTLIVAADQQEVDHSSWEVIPLSGVYNVSSYATAEGWLQSETAYATIAWVKNYEGKDGVEVIATETQRSILIRSLSNAIEIIGTQQGEPIKVYDLNGAILYAGTGDAQVTQIDAGITHGNVYVITVGERSVKYLY
ncbi:MAG: hypothetical protein LIO91_06480 [Bacteroidales bacterium]|nr:hypothetical protein [Bacteroidales bacterium]